MLETSKNSILKTLEIQRSFFATGDTKPVSFRLQQLKKLKKSIKENQTKIEAALWKDLRKSPEEAYLTEISIVLGEIDHHILNLKQWVKPKRATTPLFLRPSSSKVIYEPLGVALIIAPWNYPFQLLMNSLVGAISGGCCSILKPSPDAPTIAKLMEEMIAENFDKNYIRILQGGRETNTLLLEQKFDVILFTGSSKVGKIVMRAAAEHLTPVVLELGGKSPCIVDATANIDVAARRIAWGKLINAGQTCIAPDYLFAHASIKDELLTKIALEIEKMYGKNSQESRFYPRIVNTRSHQRLQGLLKEGTIHTGGIVDENDLFIAPTIIDNVQEDFLIMQDEIFGPILPVLSYQNIDEAIAYINKNEKPLAFYYFGKNKQAKAVLARTSSGGGCINDLLMHITNHNLPFGGVGNSGLGKYHGRESFLAFTNQRGIVSTPTWIDLRFKYVPFKFFKWTKRIM
ncbi:MAG: aldehyde dehydrogenase [Crocinitomicaceae bacterium]|nr:aldehyde dehydrogenase [Flavobacteriales bacterium]NQZ38174.1 aldehyde dehydrogenase [Crocinitomicaceae bacterium]